jgi:hypothetical protein
MLFPKFVMEDLSVGSGLIIGKSNIEEFFNHISMHEEVEETSWVELAPSVEVASVYYGTTSSEQPLRRTSPENLTGEPRRRTSSEHPRRSSACQGPDCFLQGPDRFLFCIQGSNCFLFCIQGSNCFLFYIQGPNCDSFLYLRIVVQTLDLLSFSHHTQPTKQ